MQLEELKEFFLVGGTALALQLGHRISVDLDLFTQNDFDAKKMFNELNKIFEIQDLTEETNTLNFNIVFPEKTENLIKVDLIKYSYPLINAIIEIDKIRLLSIEDIIPMKLSAVAGRGSKKDFYDIHYLLNKYNFEQMFDLFEKKFPNTNKFHILKSLTYFEDAELEPNPKTIEKSNWDKIKKEIILKANEYIKM
jgi:predicted nucleotidyltransferase component of viral defense system